MVRLVPIENDVIPMVLLVNMHLIKGTLIIFPCDLAGYRAISDGPLVPMVRLVLIENDVIPVVLLVQYKFAFTPSRNALTIIMNIPRSISQSRKTSSLLHQVKARYNYLRIFLVLEANHAKQVGFYSK